MKSTKDDDNTESADNDEDDSDNDDCISDDVVLANIVLPLLSSALTLVARILDPMQ